MGIGWVIDEATIEELRYEEGDAYLMPAWQWSPFLIHKREASTNRKQKDAMIP
jgi:hypothetical protein